MGDEVDQYWGGLWDKSPDAAHTANQEIAATLEVLRKWYRLFPEMKLCESNHGTRWKRKALQAQIPSQMMRLYQEVIQAPPGWKWAKHWDVKSKFPFRVEHGDDWGAGNPHFQAALHNGISTVMGHHHTKADIVHFRTATQSLWGAVIGCLIEFETYAFEYARNHKLKPAVGALIVTQDGRTPLWIPL